jgi:hypothetical protein
MISRETRLKRIPAWFIATLSATVMVENSKHVVCVDSSPFFAAAT